MKFVAFDWTESGNHRETNSQRKKPLISSKHQWRKEIDVAEESLGRSTWHPYTNRGGEPTLTGQGGGEFSTPLPFHYSLQEICNMPSPVSHGRTTICNQFYCKKPQNATRMNCQTQEIQSILACNESSNKNLLVSGYLERSMSHFDSILKDKTQLTMFIKNCQAHTFQCLI